MALKSLDDFRDNFVFEYKYTKKKMLIYCEQQEPIDVIDYKGEKYHVTDKSGCCIVPNTYTLGKALEYADLISDKSSKRARFKEE